MSAADQAREKLAAVEREADEIAGAYPDGLPEFMATSLVNRWQGSITAAQAHATLAVAEQLATVVGLLEVLAAPAQPLRFAAAPAETRMSTRADEQVEWQWWQDGGEAGGEWVDAYSETDANLCADNHGTKVRSRVVGSWAERAARS